MCPQDLAQLRARIGVGQSIALLKVSHLSSFPNEKVVIIIRRKGRESINRLEVICDRRIV